METTTPDNEILDELAGTAPVRSIPVPTLPPLPAPPKAPFIIQPQPISAAYRKWHSLNRINELADKILAGASHDDIKDRLFKIDLSYRDYQEVIAEIEAALPERKRFNLEAEAKRQQALAERERQKRLAREALDAGRKPNLGPTSAPAPVPAAPTLPAATFPNKTLAALATLEEYETEYDNYWISASILDQVEVVLSGLIQPKVLEKGNAILSGQHHQRKLTLRDYAFIYCAHRKNVTKNKGGASPVQGIVGLSKKAAEQGVISGEVARVHISLALKVLCALELTICISPANLDIHRAAGYRILPHPELDNLPWN